MIAALLALALAVLIPPSSATAQPTTRGLADAPVDPQTVEIAFQPRRVALVVGVDEYDDAAFPSLRFASHDAEAIGELLSDPMWGGFDVVEVLTGPERTTRQQILAALDDLTMSLHRNDTFLIYFSGHGSLEAGADGGSTLYVCPRDASPERLRHSAIAVDLLQRRLTRIPARRRVLVLDSCHNGQAKSFLAYETREDIAQRRSPLDPRVHTRVGEAEAHLFAAAFHQPALEDPHLRHGVYTHYLIEAMSRRSTDADLDGDGVITVVEAHQYARDHTIAHTGGAQVPQALFKEVGREDIFLSGGEGALLAAERGLLTSYSQLLADCRIRVDGVARGQLPQALSVEPGIHRVEVVEPHSGEVLVQRTIHVAAGRSVSVDAMADERRPEKRASFAGGLTAFGVAGPFARGYPAFSIGPDLSLRRRFRGAARSVRLTLDLGFAHGEGRYAAANDERVSADLLRAGGGVQACLDRERVNLWIGLQASVVGMRLQQQDGTNPVVQWAVVPAPRLATGIDLWGPRRTGVQLAAFADVVAPVVEHATGNTEARVGVLIGGQLRVLGALH